MPIDFSLKGKHALVCGASSGIGQAIAMAFAEAGASLTILARRADRLLALAPQLERLGSPKVQVVIADLDDRPGLATALTPAIHNRPVHVLINNAGGPAAGPLLEGRDEDFTVAFGRHVLAAQQLVRTLMPGMRDAGYGRVINIISTSVREPIANLGVSNTIRGAMASWAKSLARELPPGLTVNNILPGFTDTERLAQLRKATAGRLDTTEAAVDAQWLATVPEGRLGRPEEIAAAALFLASPAASFVRGQSLAVDGGRLASI